MSYDKIWCHDELESTVCFPLSLKSFFAFVSIVSILFFLSLFSLSPHWSPSTSSVVMRTINKKRLTNESNNTKKLRMESFEFKKWKEMTEREGKWGAMESLNLGRFVVASTVSSEEILRLSSRWVKIVCFCDYDFSSSRCRFLLSSHIIPLCRVFSAHTAENEELVVPASMSLLCLHNNS